MKPTLALVVVLLAGCTGAVTSRPPAPSPSPPMPALLPPPAPVALSPGYLVEPVYGLGLFSEEQRTAQKAIAQWARAKGIAVLPVDVVEARFERYRRGLTPNGQACGRPLSRWRARNRYAEELKLVGTLQIGVTCSDKGCSLDVRQYDGSGTFQRRWSTPYTRTRAWSYLLARLAVPDTPSGGGGLGGLLGDLRGGGVVEARSARLIVRARRARVDEDRKEISLALSEPDALRRCVPPERSVELLLAVGPAGRVERCAPTHRDTDAAECACRALTAQLELPPRTRISASVQHEAADVVTAGDHVVHGYTQTQIRRDPNNRRRFLTNVSDPSIEQWSPPPFSTVAKCFTNRAAPVDDRFLIDTYFDAGGRVRDVVIRKGEDRLSSNEGRCVKTAFRAATVPCPAKPRTGARSVLRLQIEKIGVRKPTLEEQFKKKPPRQPAPEAD
ncbi:MAG: hypothetical protein AAGA56_09060 [Myxococcota bacterium]